MELQFAKVEGDLPGLSFLDTARGVNAIVQKLLPRLQEKWVSAGTSYKCQNQVPYPSFAFFVVFVTQWACIMSDPSFSFIAHSDIAVKTKKAPWKPTRQQKASVGVHKTEVSRGNYI